MKNTTLSLHHFIKAAILLGFAMYIVYLVRTNNILYYIAPRMVDYIKWSSVGFYAMAVYQVYVGVNTLLQKKAEACGCEHDHLPSRSVAKNTMIYGLFIFPLLLGFLLPDSSMGASLAAKKGMNLSSSSTIKKGTEAPLASAPSPTPTAVPSSTPDSVGNAAPEPAGVQSGAKASTASDAKLNELFKADKFTEIYADYGKKLYQSDIITVKEDSYIETLTTVDLYLDNFIGKKLELDGFVYRQDNMNDKQFVVGRFAIQCCSADAAPFGVLVEYDRAKMLETDAWVHAVGTIQKTKFNDTDIMMLKLEKFSKIEKPQTEYVYPNYEFGF